MGRNQTCNRDCLNCPLPDCVVERTKAEYQVEYHAKKYWERKAAGLCTHCGKAPARRPGKAVCAECAARMREASRKTNDRKMAAGLCTRCGRIPPRPGRRMCEECAKWVNAQNAACRRKKAERNGTEEKM